MYLLFPVPLRGHQWPPECLACPMALSVAGHLCFSQDLSLVKPSWKFSLAGP